ncbi:MAG TPA: folylpolyglutamate synthase/dihydrofolate synthase family protein [Opitutus sp.]|nr:folylpolyglutamate synthase/dihydrofolate synthase family protein [Opitutus sp.]
MKTYADTQAYLYALKSRGYAPGLDRMRRVAAALGDPHQAVPSIHIAGTNGKGSVSAMLEAILRAAGWRVGLYTSPHLVRLGERIQVDRRLLSEGEIVAYARELRPLADAENLTYFETMTAMAFAHFAQARCDVAVLEVGLGGRLDATNIVTPEVSVITSIGLDHADVLGSTLAAIAAEKAGIIKPHRPLVLGRLPDEAEAVIRRIAGERAAPIISVRHEFGGDLARYPRTNLAGDYQRWNAATATLAARALPSRWRIADDLVTSALRTVDWPARWQRIDLADRTLILDSSHNAEGATVLDANLAQLAAATGRAPVVICGVLGLDRARPIVAAICRHAREIHFVVPSQARASSHAQLESVVPPEFRGRVAADTLERLFPAPGVCVAGGPGDVIVVAGSIYLAGEVLGLLESARGRGEGGLQDF